MDQVSKWKEEALCRADIIVQNKKRPNDHMKVCCKLSSPICCFPCYIWSFIWRILYCPYQCMCNNPRLIVSENNCTMCSDVYISSYFEAVDYGYDAIYSPLPETYDSEIKKELLSTLKFVFETMQSTENINQKYKLCDLIIQMIQSIIRVKLSAKTKATIYPSMQWEHLEMMIF